MFQRLKQKFSYLFDLKKSITTTAKVNKYRKSTSNFSSFCRTLQSHCLLISDKTLQLIEDEFIKNDFGPIIATKLSQEILSEIKHHQIKNAELILEIILDKLLTFYIGDQIIDLNLNLEPERTNVILISGVNGVGKTTTIAKLAHYLKAPEYKILLIAADTFRSGAVEQLKEWSQRLNVAIFQPNLKHQTPASVIYQGLEYAKTNNFNLVICDTSGRLENKQNLLKELTKIDQVIKKLVPTAPHESLLILDATIGQSGLQQAKVFQETLKLTGLILTKTDSTSKGGIIFAIKDSLNLQVKFIGTGEQITNLEEFKLQEFFSNIIQLNLFTEKS